MVRYDKFEIFETSSLSNGTHRRDNIAYHEVLAAGDKALVEGKNKITTRRNHDYYWRKDQRLHPQNLECHQGKR